MREVAWMMKGADARLCRLLSHKYKQMCTNDDNCAVVWHSQVLLCTKLPLGPCFPP
ncbi:Scorpion toxin-like protein [Dioscorea alata]|uniref:Scorpion toxin-like protein n=1 Tax=Dioscorea alata TaxID=55571 RepID=A0ACB7U2Q5_DIOAL|nr:Scorpion toxin-like protein [Dioscorea alata]